MLDQKLYIVPLPRWYKKSLRSKKGIVGPVALEQASKVPGLILNWEKHEIKFEGDKKEIIEKLVEQYEYLFGQASVEVCKDAVKKIIGEVPQDQIPQVLL